MPTSRSISFGPTANLQQPFTSDLQAVADAIAVLDTAGETALYDGMNLALDQFSLSRNSRRTIVVLSDGEDTVSALTPSALVERLSTADTDVFAVSLGNAQVDLLQQLVDAADGGFVAAADRASDLTELYSQIASLLANQYRLSFIPTTNVSPVGRVYVSQLGIDAAADFEFSSFDANAGSDLDPADEVLAGTDPATQPTPVIVSAPLLSSKWAMGAGLAAMGLALFLAAQLLLNAGPAFRLASAKAGTMARPGSVTNSARNVRDRMEGMAERALERRDRGRLVGSALERAGLALRPAEFVVLVGAVAFVAAAVTGLSSGPIGAAAAAAVVIIAARSWLSYKATRRSEAFTEQLTQTVQLLAGSLRAGHALPQAVEVLAREADSPTCDEFQRLVAELRLGRDMAHSLQAMSERVRSQDFEWVVRAIEIHRGVGGNLAEVLDNIQVTIRDRNYVRRQFKSLSAEGRYSAYLLISLPFLVVAALLVTTPDYINKIFESGNGRLLGIGALVNLAIGSAWLKSILRVRF